MDAEAARSPSGRGRSASAGIEEAGVEAPSPHGRGHSDSAEATGGEGAGPSATPDDAAWAEVLSRWDDEETHRAYLERFADLDGLAAAGRRYREALAQKPGDPVAARWREEILKRATVQGLAQLPRLSPPGASPRLYRWAVLAGMIAAMATAVGWMAWRLLSMARG